MTEIGPSPSLTVATQRRVKRGKQPAPVFSLSALEQHQLKAVTCDMILRDLVPAAMLDRHARLVPHRFNAWGTFHMAAVSRDTPAGTCRFDGGG